MWALLILAIVADHLVTEYAIRRHGVEVEGNPLFRASWKRQGGLASMLLQAGILLSLQRLVERWAPEASFVAPLILWLTVLLNVRVLMRLSRRP